MPAASLEVQALSAGYGNTKVIDNISLKVEQGKTAAIFGRNGVGKTTLLATLMGHTRRYAGTIKLDGLDVAALDTPIRARHGLGYVPQTRDIFGSLTVEENLRAGLKNRPAGAIAEAYGLFPRLFERRKLPGGSLSGGEQQMLSVARTLLGKPRVLLLDEPLDDLSPGARGGWLDDNTPGRTADRTGAWLCARRLYSRARASRLDGNRRTAEVQLNHS
jgi:branched-chain amino acid transport system ATP-binding protein